MVNIVSSGIAGCGEKEYYKDFAEFCAKKGRKVNVISVTDEVLEAAKETTAEITRYNILNFPKSTRNAWHQDALDNILRERLKKDAINIINIHLTYWWKESPEEVVSANILNSFFEKLKPLFFVQITDGLEFIKERIDKVAENMGRALDLEGVIRWRDFESFVTELFSQIHKKEYYLLPKEQSPDTLFRLIFDNRLKIYFSFPITFAADHIKKRTEKFIKKLDEIAIVFDPYKVEKFEHFPQKLKSLGAEVIIKRDYRLINQSDFVVAYFPIVASSSGMITEINYANSNGKIVYLIWPDKKYSPWTVYPARKVFFSPEACLKELRAVARQRKPRR